MRALVVVPLALALLGSGCAKKLSDFDTFACAQDHACPAGYTCVANACRPVQAGGACAVQSEWSSSGPIAQQVTTDPCTFLGQSFHCVLGTCTSIGEGAACDSSASSDPCAQVSAELKCARGYERCLKKGCGGNATCSSGTVCVNDLCVPSCPGGGGCGAGEHCAVTASGAACFPPSQGPGASCADGTSCPSFSPSLVCASGTCALSCGPSAACPNGLSCVSGACVNDCTAGEPCPGGLSCLSLGRADGVKVCGTAGSGAGAACTSSASCASGLQCNAGLCGPPCGGDFDCPTGSACTGVIGASICVADCASATCPSGTTCQDYPGGKRLCLPPGSGVGASCGGACAAAELSCVGGTCRLPCANGAGCGTGAVCSAGTGAGGCLVDCTASGTCPSGSSCQPVRYSPKRACVANGSYLPACKSVSKTSDCMLCGPQYEIPAGSGVRCTSGSSTWYCPVHSSCGNAASFGCNCASGYQSKSCGGVPCSNADAGCDWPSWSCVPNTPPTPACADFPANYVGSCRCVDGRQLSFDCGTSESCEKLCADGCNVAAQDCGAGKKCSLVTSDGGLSLGFTETECVSEGSALAGQPCTRAAPGIDTCVKGAYCTRVAPAGTMVCRKLCRRDTDCGASEACINDDYFSSFPSYGMCLQRCGPTVAPGSGACPSGMGCSFLWDVDNVSAIAACRQLGTATVNQPCSFDGECGSELECAGGACRAECGASVSCAVGACHRFSGTTGNAVGAGYCQ